MTALFYCKPTAKDVLYLLIDPEKTPDEVVKKGDTVGLFYQKQLIGVNFLNFSRLVKIKAEGRITNPPEAMLEIVKNELQKASFPIPDFSCSSGFTVARVMNLEEHPLDERKQIVTLECAGKTLTTSSRYQNLQIGSKIVVLLDRTIRFDGTVFHSSVIRNIPQDCEIASPHDLGLSEESKSAYIEEEKEVGSDFFA